MEAAPTAKMRFQICRPALMRVWFVIEVILGWVLV
jgi:hypothetical protein